MVSASQLAALKKWSCVRILLIYLTELSAHNHDYVK